jgi:mannose-6-phosphate isomerase-like protein (cupin superfamily)
MAPEHGRTTIQRDEGDSVDLGGLGVVFKIDGSETGGLFAVVEHPIEPRALAAPLHRHRNEDEYSFVLEGTLGALLGEEVVTAGPGTWVFKPRGQWHTFWNAGDSPCRIIEVIAPAGFERFFRELGDVLASAEPNDRERFAGIRARYELEMDLSSVSGLCERFGLRSADA